jgi:hypothetical protein
VRERDMSSGGRHVRGVLRYGIVYFACSEALVQMIPLVMCL